MLRSRKAMLALMVAMWATVGAVMVSSPANAAVVPGAITNVTVTPTDPNVYEPVRTTIDWCVPTGTAEGDTFSLTMPEQFASLPQSFELRDPQDRLVASATVAGDPPVATFTMTDYVEQFSNVCGSAFFVSDLENDLAGTTQTLTYTLNDEIDFPVEIVVDDTIAVGPDRDVPNKEGYFREPGDQCRTVVVDCLGWQIDSPTGPFDIVTITDATPGGWTFSCDFVFPRIATIGADGEIAETFLPSSVGATATVDCTPQQLQVTFTDVPADTIATVTARATADVPGGAGGIDYVNAAVVSTTQAGVTIDGEVDNIQTSGDAGGNGSGDLISIEKLDTDGNDADDQDTAATLADGTADLVFTISNDGATELVDIVVSDTVVTGGQVDDLTCDFSTAAEGAPTTGTEWDGPFAPGATFECTAALSGVEPGETHTDVATVTGTGSASGLTVVDDDPYVAVVPEAPVTTTTTEAPTTTTTEAPSTTTTEAPTATTSVAVSPDGPPESPDNGGTSTPTNTGPSLAFTGISAGQFVLWAALLVLTGLFLLGVTRLNRAD